MCNFANFLNFSRTSHWIWISVLLKERKNERHNAASFMLSSVHFLKATLSRGIPWNIPLVTSDSWDIPWYTTRKRCMTRLSSYNHTIVSYLLYEFVERETDNQREALSTQNPLTVRIDALFDIYLRWCRLHCVIDLHDHCPASPS